MKAKSGIHIKKSKVGTLHDALGISRDKPIPTPKLKDKPGDSPALKKKKNFARNARKWNHAQSGITDLKPDRLAANPKDISEVTIPSNKLTTLRPEQLAQNPRDMYNLSNPPSLQRMEGGLADNYYDRPFNYGKAATDVLFGLDFLLPKEHQIKPVVQPQVGYTEHPYGTGSQAIYRHGGDLPCYDCGGEMQYGGDMSMTGYKRNSPDRYKPSLTIPSGNITMRDVDFPIYGLDNLGNGEMMHPGRDYRFPGSEVKEYPLQELEGIYSDKAEAGHWILPRGVEATGYYTPKNPYNIENGGKITGGMFSSGVIKPQPDVYNPVYQVGGNISGGYSGIIPGLTGTMYSRGAYKYSEKVTDQMMAADGSFIPYGDLADETITQAKGGWIGKAAASIKRRGTKGKCTPITKPGCTGRAKALAKTFKKIARNRKKAEDGNNLYNNNLDTYYEEGEQYDISPEQVQHLVTNGYDIQLI